MRKGAAEMTRPRGRGTQQGFSSHPSLSSLLPPQVQVLLEELAVVQEEIIWLERKIEELKLRLYQEREQNKGTKIQHLRDLPKDSHLLCGPKNWPVLNDQRSRSQNYDEFRKERITKERRSSLGSVSEILSMYSYLLGILCINFVVLDTITM